MAPLPHGMAPLRRGWRLAPTAGASPARLAPRPHGWRLARSQATPPLWAGRKYVAFVSESTHGFLTVAMPPQQNSLFPSAFTDKLSLQSVFALLPSGHSNRARRPNSGVSNFHFWVVWPFMGALGGIQHYAPQRMKASGAQCSARFGAQASSAYQPCPSM